MPETTPDPRVPVVTATPSRTPSPTPEWTIAFDGECDNMLTSSELETLLGPGAVENSSVTADALIEPVCHWRFDALVCRQAAAADGLWVMTILSPMDEDEPAPVDVLEPAIVAALAAAADHAPGVPAPATADRWASVECAALGERMGLGDILGVDYWSGYWEGSRRVEDDVLQHAGVRQFCQYSSGQISKTDAHYIVSLISEPGGAWRWDRVAAGGGEPVTIPGATEALQILDESETLPRDTIYAVDGSNLLWVTVSAARSPRRSPSGRSPHWAADGPVPLACAGA